MKFSVSLGGGVVAMVVAMAVARAEERSLGGGVVAIAVARAV